MAKYHRIFKKVAPSTMRMRSSASCQQRNVIREWLEALVHSVLLNGSSATATRCQYQCRREGDVQKYLPYQCHGPFDILQWWDLFKSQPVVKAQQLQDTILTK